MYAIKHKSPYNESIRIELLCKDRMPNHPVLLCIVDYVSPEQGLPYCYFNGIKYSYANGQYYPENYQTKD